LAGRNKTGRRELFTFFTETEVQFGFFSLSVWLYRNSTSLIAEFDAEDSTLILPSLLTLVSSKYG
jgi:hypothetical protein